MKCSHCDTPNRPGTRYCKHCSRSLQRPCNHCGLFIDITATNCHHCLTEPRGTLATQRIDTATPGDATIITTLPYELRATYVGNRNALTELVELYEGLITDGHSPFVVLLGEPGMGKSRTMKEFARQVGEKDRRIRFLYGRCEGSGLAYRAIARLLNMRFGITVGDASEVCQEKIVVGVSEVVDSHRVTEVSHLLAYMMGVAFTDSLVVTPLLETPQQLQSRLFMAVRRFLEADAAAGPLILAIEDLEYAGSETVNLLHYLAAGLATSPILLVATARENIYERHPMFGGGGADLKRIELEPLTPSETEELLAQLCRPLDSLPDRLINHMKTIAGSPRSAYELLRLLLERDVIVRSGSLSWRVDTQALARVELPTTEEELVRARLAAMPQDQRDLIQKAAVIGSTFWLDAIVALVRSETLAQDGGEPDGASLRDIAEAGDFTRMQVAKGLAVLIDCEWIEENRVSSIPGEREYRFSYPILWSLVYDEIDNRRRQDCHRAVAQWLELQPSGRDGLTIEDIGRHLELAGDPVAAATRYRRAANAASSRFANKKAIALFNQALSCLGHKETAARIHIWHDLGSVYELRGDFDNAQRSYERMLRLAWLAASRNKAAVAFNKMGRVFRRKGDLRLSLEYLTRSLELFEQARDERGIAGSYDDIGNVHRLLGNYDRAFEFANKGLGKRRHNKDTRSIAGSLSNLGSIQHDRGNLTEAYRHHKEALDLRRKLQDRVGTIVSLNNLAIVSVDLGDPDNARSMWDQALAEAQDIEALPLQALALAKLGELSLSESKYDEARTRLHSALEMARDIDDLLLQVETTRNLAKLENNEGDQSRAVAMAESARNIAADAGLRDQEGRALFTLAEVHSGTLFDAEQSLRGRHPQCNAAVYFEKGVELFRTIGHESELAKGLELYGRHKVELGNMVDGKALLEEAFELFHKLGMPRQHVVQELLDRI